MPRPEIHLIVCVNDRDPAAGKPCCGGRRGHDLYRRFKDLIRTGGLRDRVLVSRSGCLRHCSRGATVVAWPSHHWYGGVEPEDAAELLESELAGRELERLRMPPGPWE